MAEIAWKASAIGDHFLYNSFYVSRVLFKTKINRPFIEWKEEAQCGRNPERQQAPPKAIGQLAFASTIICLHFASTLIFTFVQYNVGQSISQTDINAIGTWTYLAPGGLLELIMI